MFLGFKALPLKDKFTTTVAAFSIAVSTVAALSYIGSIDTVQKLHVKHKLLRMKFPKPIHLDEVNAA